jgi:hypothetical protein
MLCRCKTSLRAAWRFSLPTTPVMRMPHVTCWMELPGCNCSSTHRRSCELERGIDDEDRLLGSIPPKFIVRVFVSRPPIGKRIVSGSSSYETNKDADSNAQENILLKIYCRRDPTGFHQKLRPPGIKRGSIQLPTENSGPVAKSPSICAIPVPCYDLRAIENEALMSLFAAHGSQAMNVGSHAGNFRSTTTSGTCKILLPARRQQRGESRWPA